MDEGGGCGEGQVGGHRGRSGAGDDGVVNRGGGGGCLWAGSATCWHKWGMRAVHACMHACGVLLSRGPEMPPTLPPSHQSHLTEWSWQTRLIPPRPLHAPAPAPGPPAPVNMHATPHSHIRRSGGCSECGRPGALRLASRVHCRPAAGLLASGQ